MYLNNLALLVGLVSHSAGELVFGDISVFRAGCIHFQVHGYTILNMELNETSIRTQNCTRQSLPISLSTASYDFSLCCL